MTTCEEKENKGQIYCISNTINDMKYVGQTFQYRRAGKYIKKFGFQGRFIEHKAQSSYKKASVLAKAMQELGVDNFKVELLEECDSTVNIDDRERYWIDKLGTLYPAGYNVLYGAPYTHDPSVKAKISEGMTAFFQNEKVRKIYSKAHINHFKDVVTDGITSIDIRPIKANGANKIVYMYISYLDGSQVRRRYGGTHEEYDDAYKRCYNDAQSLANGNAALVKTPKSRVERCSSQLQSTKIESIELRLHTMKEHKMVSVYVSQCDMKDKKRYVFGGKTISLSNAFMSAMEFVDTIKSQSTNIIIKESLRVATLTN